VPPQARNQDPKTGNAYRDEAYRGLEQEDVKEMSALYQQCRTLGERFINDYDNDNLLNYYTKKLILLKYYTLSFLLLTYHTSELNY
jgi:hypothetical protein